MARTPGGRRKQKRKEYPSKPNDGHEPIFGGTIRGRYHTLPIKKTKNRKKPRLKSTARTQNKFYK